MKNPLAETLAALNNDPKVHHASGVGEERTLILDMIDEMVASASERDGGAFDGMHPTDVAEHIAACIRRDYHRRNFDA